MRNQSIVLLKAFFPLAAFKIFSLFLVFCSFIMIYIYIYRCGFLFIYPKWDCKEFLILWIDVSISSGKISATSSSNITSAPLSFCIPPGTPVKCVWSFHYILCLLSSLLCILSSCLCFILETSFDLSYCSFILHV